jgi:excisionase family DNA binding protein
MNKPPDSQIALLFQHLRAILDVLEELMHRPPDPAIIRLVQALARDAAREDHAKKAKDIVQSSTVSVPEADRLTMSVPEAGRLLGLSRGSSYEAAKRGEIPTIRIGRLLLVPISAFDRTLNPQVKIVTSHRAPPTDA